MIPMDSGGVSLVDMLGEEALIVRALSLNGAFEGDLGTTANERDFHEAEVPAANVE